jgi:hypothetical protein
MSPETKTMSSFPAAADEIAWIQARHAIELCQQVAELAARAHRRGSGGAGLPPGCDPPFGAGLGVLAVPPDVVTRRAPVGQHLAAVLVGATHPAGDDIAAQRGRALRERRASCVSYH